MLASEAGRIEVVCAVWAAQLGAISSSPCVPELALAEGVATKTHVLNILHRLVDGKTTTGPDIDTPQALALRREPKADVGRYDALRARTAGGRHAS